MASKTIILFAALALGLLYSCQADFISSFCSLTSQSAPCVRYLQSNPRTKGVTDFGQLGKIMVNEAIVGAKLAVRAVKRFGQGQKADTCVEVCSLAVDDLHDCRDLIDSRDESDIDSLQSWASSALTNLGTCDQDVYEGMAPPQIARATQKAELQVIIVLNAILHLRQNEGP